MKIRPLEKDESGHLAALHAAAFAKGWSALELAGLIVQPHTISLGAIREDQIAAFILVRCLAGEAEILTLATHPRFQRMGMARQLVDKARRACRAEGAETLFLEVSEDNAAAIELYTGTGFERFGVRKHYYADGSDAVLMQMAL